MSTTHASFEDYHEPERYEIRIKGHLDDRWTAWFGVYWLLGASVL
jgi:hypothetical protein